MTPGGEMAQDNITRWEREAREANEPLFAAFICAVRQEREKCASIATGNVEVRR